MLFSSFLCGNLLYMCVYVYLHALCSLCIVNGSEPLPTFLLEYSILKLDL